MEMHKDSPVPEFGAQSAGETYVSRPGSYALILNEAGQLAVLQTPGGHHLPGGGRENGETPEETLFREVREECGFSVCDAQRLCQAVEYVHTSGNDFGIRKECIFFVATVGEVSGVGGENDHTLVWLPPNAAEEILTHGSQQWAVRQFTSQR